MGQPTVGSNPTPSALGYVSWSVGGHTGDVNLETVVSILAVGFTVAFAWPQVFRALRHGVDGISVGAVTQSLISASAWFGYGLAQRLPPVMIADVGVIAGQLIVTVLLVRNNALTKSRATAVVVVAIALIAICQIPLLTTPIAMIAGLVALTSALTQLIEVIREPDALEGLSAATYGILTIVACCWLAYGLLRGDMVIIVTNILMIPMAAYITWAASHSHHDHEAEFEDHHHDDAAVPQQQPADRVTD